MNNRIKLSIVIPVYNVEAYIGRCLESLIGIDSFIDNEVIVVNDGTKDNSMKVVNGFHKFFRNFYIINQENRGLSAARNAGIEYSSGEYIYFLDSDDYVSLPEFCNVFSKIESIGSDCIVGNYFDDINGALIYGSSRIKTHSDIVMNGETFFTKYYKYIDTPVWRCIYRSSLIKDNNFKFTEGVMHEDVNWSPKLYISAAKVAYTPVPFYRYVHRSGSIQHSSFSDKRLDSLLNVYSDLVEFGKSKSMSVQKSINRRAAISALVLIGLGGGNINKTKENEIKRLLFNDLAQDLLTKLIKALYTISPPLIHQMLYLKYRNYRFGF